MQNRQKIKFLNRLNQYSLVIVITIATFFLGLNNTHAIDSLSVSLKLKTELSNTFEKLQFGIHKDATVQIDDALGEKRLPPFPPPSGLYSVFKIYDSTTQVIEWSYINFMPIPKNNKDSVTYKFEVFNTTETLTIEWRPLSDLVDSAVIMDDYTGNLVHINLKDSLSAVIENSAIKKFKILAWYKVPVSVEDNFSKDDLAISIFPNPISDYFEVKTKNSNFKYNIINQLGEIVLNGAISYYSGKISVKYLNEGAYFLIIYLPDNRILVRQFIKCI